METFCNFTQSDKNTDFFLFFKETIVKRVQKLVTFGKSVVFMKLLSMKLGGNIG